MVYEITEVKRHIISEIPEENVFHKNLGVDYR